MFSEAGHEVCWFWSFLGEGLRCRPMSDAARDWPLVTCLELQSHPQFVAASAGPWCEWQGPNCARGLAFSCAGTRGGVSKSPKAPRDLPWPATACWLPDATQLLMQAQLLKKPLVRLELHEVGFQ